MNNAAQTERPRDIIEDTVLRYCGPLLFISSLQPPIRVLDNATFGLIDTGEKKLLVTCHHVWDYLVTVRQKHPKAEIAANFAPGLTVTISDAEIIDSDSDLDIAVIDPKLRPSDLSHLAFFRISKWPIPTVTPGEVVAFVGYPRAGFASFDNHGNFGSLFFGLQVSSVNDRSIMLLNDRPATKLEGLYGEELPSEKASGLSGSPAYRLGAQGLELVGIVRDGRSTDGLIILTQMCFLNPNGTIRKPASNLI